MGNVYRRRRLWRALLVENLPHVADPTRQLMQTPRGHTLSSKGCFAGEGGECHRFSRENGHPITTETCAADPRHSVLLGGGVWRSRAPTGLPFAQITADKFPLTASMARHPPRLLAMMARRPDGHVWRTTSNMRQRHDPHHHSSPYKRITTSPRRGHQSSGLHHLIHPAFNLNFFRRLESRYRFTCSYG